MLNLVIPDLFFIIIKNWQGFYYNFNYFNANNDNDNTENERLLKTFLAKLIF